MKTRYSARRTTTCKVTLSCGARVGEGQILDLTVPGCLIETAVVLDVGSQSNSACTWTSTGPCASTLELCDGPRMARRALSSSGWPETTDCGSGFMWVISTNDGRLAAAGQKPRSAWAIEMSQVDVRERERLLNTVLLCCTPYRGTRRGQGPSL